MIHRGQTHGQGGQFNNKNVSCANLYKNILTRINKSIIVLGDKCSFKFSLLGYQIFAYSSVARLCAPRNYCTLSGQVVQPVVQLLAAHKQIKRLTANFLVNLLILLCLKCVYTAQQFIFGAKMMHLQSRILRVKTMCDKIIYIYSQ